MSQYRARMIRYLQDQEDVKIFLEALEFAHSLHAGQRRKSGAPYISHPCAVAEILARELQIKDPVLLSGALLHDVVEDVPTIQVDDVEERFGSTVAELVDGCTKLTRHHVDRATLKDLTHSKIFLSASRRLGVLVIKLADRLHNLRTLHFLPLAKRQHIAHETVEVYAPVAAKFNIFPLKRELYHLALTFLYPRKSKKILQYLRDLRGSQKVLDIEGRLNNLFDSRGLSVTVRPRVKGLGSYYNSLKRTLELTNGENHVDFAIVLQADDVLSCYTALGLVNTTFVPIPKTVRDFIASPKTNGYKSLHVRFHEGGENYLIKIRTFDMDQWATYGILRNWAEQKPISDEHWQEVSDLLRSIGEYGGAAPQRKALIRLSESEEIFSYTPKGDIHYLPKGSVVLDFAYKIHSEIGDHCEGAYVNGQWALPTRQLIDGDTVEIITSKELLDPGPELEELCRTPKARTAINRHLQQKRRKYAQDVGRHILLQELEKHGLHPELLESESTKLILEFLNVRDLSDLFVRLGQDLMSPHVVLYYFGAPPPILSQAAHRGEAGADDDAQHNLLHVAEPDRAIHKFARCCNPYPGQDHVVATLSERGVTFHHRECEDLRTRHELEPQQLLDVEWSMDTPWRHPLTFHLHVFRETAVSLARALVLLPDSLFVHHLESVVDKHDQPMIRMAVRLRRFEEARFLFESLPQGRTAIEDYSRAQWPKRLHAGQPERALHREEAMGDRL